MRYNKWVYYCMSLKRLPTPKTCVELFVLLGRQRYQNFDVLSLSLYTFSLLASKLCSYTLLFSIYVMPWIFSAALMPSVLSVAKLTGPLDKYNNKLIILK
jgi:hypothetical protein